MHRFVFRYAEPAPAPAADLTVIKSHPGVTVLDATPRMLLVRTTQAAADELAGSLDGWVVAPAQTTPVPDTRPKPRTPPRR